MAYGHGKVILLGEHAVVYGKRGLAFAVERGAEVGASAVDTGLTSLHITPWNVTVDTGSAPNLGREPLQEALRVARTFYEDGLHHALHAHMIVPAGAGMGSSAALGVAVLRALDDARGLTRTDAELFERSLAWEKVFHGTPSGLDNAMAVHGGIALFKRADRAGDPPELKPVVPRHLMKFVVGDSGEPRIAKRMLDIVRHLVQTQAARMERDLDGIDRLTMAGKNAIEQGNLRDLGQLMDLNHMLLAGFTLSTATLDEMIAAARAAGALGAKLTGAGGGGCMLALVDSDAARLRVHTALTDMGKAVYDVDIGP
jgi:mevalonate kinase